MKYIIISSILTIIIRIFSDYIIGYNSNFMEGTILNLLIYQLLYERSRRNNQ